MSLIRRMSTGLVIGTLLALVLVSGVPLVASTAPSSVKYVATGGACSGATPCFAAIQAAVDASDAGDEIRVAAGTYTGAHTVSFDQPGRLFHFTQVVFIDKSLSLLGGYTPTNWTIQDRVANATIVDTNQEGRGVTIYSVGYEPVRIDGFTITGGDFNGLGNVGSGRHLCARTGSDCGGGLYAFNVQLILQRCTISGDSAGTTKNYSDGGGLHLWSLTEGSRLEDLVVSGNSADSSGGQGGGILVKSGAGLTIVRSTVSGNTADGGGAGMEMASVQFGPLIIEDSVFSDNVAPGGYNDNEDGGALRARVSRTGPALILNRVTMDGNQAGRRGAAIFLRKDGSGNTSEVTLTNLMLTNNSTTSDDEIGSVITITEGFGLDLHLAHVTAADNAAPAFLRALAVEEGEQLSVNISNTIVYSATHAFVAAQDVGGVTLRHTNTLAFNVSELHHVEEGAPSIEALDTLYGNPALDSSHRLQSGSAAIDTGIDAGVTTDIDGDFRPQGSGYDIGADEFAVGVAPGQRTYLPIVTL